MVLSSIHGSFHQGCVEMFGDSSGRQCSCIALPVIKDVSRWSENDLDLILVNGDQLYKNQNTDIYLLATELPTNFYVGKCKALIKMEDTSKVGVLQSAISLDNLINRSSWSGSIFFVSGYWFAIIPTKSNIVYVFDSHSRNAVGKQCADGSSVLLKFSDINMLAGYIYDTYFNANEVIQYENNFCSISFEDGLQEDKARCKLLLNKLRKKLRKRKLDQNKNDLSSVVKVVSAPVDFVVHSSVLSNNMYAEPSTDSKVNLVHQNGSGFPFMSSSVSCTSSVSSVKSISVLTSVSFASSNFVGPSVSACPSVSAHQDFSIGHGISDCPSTPSGPSISLSASPGISVSRPDEFS